MKNTYSRIKSFSQFALIVGFFLAGNNIALAQTIPEILADYEVFTTSIPTKHDGARIIIMRTEDASNMAADDASYGLAFISNLSTGTSLRGGGLICNNAKLILEKSAITCVKHRTNPAGKIVFTETFTVGVSGSFYCNALRESLVQHSHADKILDQTDAECDGVGAQCICYDIDHRGPGAFNPPSQGSGSGRGGG